MDPQFRHKKYVLTLLLAMQGIVSGSGIQVVAWECGDAD
jgi:hypothetical protein